MTQSPAGHSASPTGDVEISIVVPTRRGGELLRRLIETVRAQRTDRAFEILLIDSGSDPSELEALRRAGARVESIAPEQFDHGATRDLAARLARGSIVVFLNQDCLPVGEVWLEGLVAPLLADDPPAAVQGAIREFPVTELERDGRRRFFWDSGGARFNYTRESRDWISHHGGLGFSTVHCAIRRAVWEEIPFGPTPILEDKKWQRAASDRGYRIVDVDEHRALVWHSHEYDLRSLLRRSLSEGLGWRLVGSKYRLRHALGDLVDRGTWREWRAGIRSGALRGAAELLFPIVRPLGLWWGNRWAQRVRH